MSPADKRRQRKYDFNKPSTPYSLDQFKVKALDYLSYDVGDRVRHIKFGVGTVEVIIKNGSDFQVTVNFDKVGKKKMYASFAKL